jgi:hypothetical protein
MPVLHIYDVFDSLQISIFLLLFAVCLFLGMTGYYRQHIQNYADVARQLTELTKKNEPFI